MMKYIVWILLILLPSSTPSSSLSTIPSASPTFVNASLDSENTEIVISDSDTTETETQTDDCEGDARNKMVGILKSDKDYKHYSKGRLSDEENMCLFMGKNDTVKESLAFDYYLCSIRTTNIQWAVQQDDACHYIGTNAALLRRCVDRLEGRQLHAYMTVLTNIIKSCYDKSCIAYVLMLSTEEIDQYDDILTQTMIPTFKDWGKEMEEQDRKWQEDFENFEESSALLKQFRENIQSLMVSLSGSLPELQEIFKGVKKNFELLTAVWSISPNMIFCVHIYLIVFPGIRGGDRWRWRCAVQALLLCFRLIGLFIRFGSQWLFAAALVVFALSEFLLFSSNERKARESQMQSRSMGTLIGQLEETAKYLQEVDSGETLEQEVDSSEMLEQEVGSGEMLEEDDDAEVRVPKALPLFFLVFIVFFLWVAYDDIVNVYYDNFAAVKVDKE
jgi:hypothetical protein